MHLITLGMQPDARFVEFWSTGHAGLPFCSCSASDLYTAFRAWCRINGERFIPSMTAFGRTVTEFLERKEAPPKAVKRFFGYSDKEVKEGDMGGEALQRQGVLYFVPAQIELMSTPVQGDERPPIPDPLPDCTQPAHYNSRIKMFQHQLHDLISCARRVV